MKKLIVVSLLVMAAYVSMLGAVHAAEADKGLAPGWLSLDSSVGVLDNSIASGKSSIENALGIGISGYLDGTYTWSSNLPKNPKRISGRYFYGDQNQVYFNNFHIALDKPEKDWGVGFRISGDFGRTGELLAEATFWVPR